MQLCRADLQGLSVEVDLSHVRQPLVGKLLAWIRLFKHLSEAQRHSVAGLLDVMWMERGEHVFQQGDYGTAMYVVSMGRVEIYRRAAMTSSKGSSEPTKSLSGVLPIAVCVPTSPRPWFGELALVTGNPRAASAVCSEPTRLLILDRLHFRDFLTLVPSFQDVFDASSRGYAALDSIYVDSDSPRKAFVVPAWERLVSRLLVEAKQQEGDAEGSER